MKDPGGGGGGWNIIVVPGAGGGGGTPIGNGKKGIIMGRIPPDAIFAAAVANVE